VNALVFLVLAALTIAAALAVVVNRNPVYSALALVSTLALMSCFFVGLEAYLVWALQLVVYAGAIVVLFLFVIMLLNIGRERSSGARSPAQTWSAVILALLLAGSLGRLVWDAHKDSEAPPLDATFVSLRGLSEQLFSSYLLPFELIGLLLLVAVVAASWLARRHEEDEPEVAAPSPEDRP